MFIDWFISTKHPPVASIPLRPCGKIIKSFYLKIAYVWTRPKCDKIVYCNNLFFRELWRKSGRDSCINIHNLKSTKWAELCFSMPLFSCSLQRQSCALKHNNLMVESTTVQQLRNTGKEGWTFTDVILIMHLILVTRSKYYFSKNRNSLEYKVELLTILL